MSKYIKSAVLGLGLMIASAGVNGQTNWDINENDMGDIPPPPRPPRKDIPFDIPIPGHTWGTPDYPYK